ncbi:single-stranded DNA-binding protein [Pantoea sp.]|jgi:hypothetical protein|uniref:single-stranded DNA-binding protein n=1 Tax=Pantoea sp. TaxID=69393 RepID=UPI00257B13C7|nr:single-stranded DNA-binding protein [Pantoea sp.]MDU5476120.1 single-stranded DNA-binding protein [Pantoea sp.]
MSKVDSLIIQIMPSQVAIENVSGTSKNSGKPFSINKQAGYAYNGDEFPVKFEFVVDEGVEPYPAGKYTLHPSSYKVGDFGRLTIDRVLLVPAEA